MWWLPAGHCERKILYIEQKFKMENCTNVLMCSADVLVRACRTHRVHSIRFTLAKFQWKRKNETKCDADGNVATQPTKKKTLSRLYVPVNCEYIIWLLVNGSTTTSILLAGCIEFAALHLHLHNKSIFRKKIYFSIFAFCWTQRTRLHIGNVFKYGSVANVFAQWR